MAEASPPAILHASCVVRNGRAVLIRGASGSGKSGLALQLMAYGAALIADDRTELRLRDGHPWASCPDPIKGRIEARGIGLLRVMPAAPAPVTLVVDLDLRETDRLPPLRDIRLLGVSIPLVHKIEGAHFAAALWHYLATGRDA